MKGRSIQSAMLAGLAYFTVVFAIGFALGTLRVLVMLPALGEILAVTLELPFILAVSWLASRWLVSRFEVEATFAPRVVMGGLAFALLMTAEVLLATLGFGRTLQEHLPTIARCRLCWDWRDSSRSPRFRSSN
jgi:hypothetical protein